MLPDSPERAQHDLTLQLALGSPLSMLKDYVAPEVEYAYTRAYTLCQQMGESPQVFSVLAGLWRVHLTRGHLQTTRELAEQCFSLAQRLQDPALLQEAHQKLGTTLVYLGELVPARAHLEQGIALYDPQQGHAQFLSGGPAPGVACRPSTALTLWLLGYPERALRRMDEASPWPRSCHIRTAWGLPYTLPPPSISGAGRRRWCKKS